MQSVTALDVCVLFFLIVVLVHKIIENDYSNYLTSKLKHKKMVPAVITVN